MGGDGERVDRPNDIAAAIQRASTLCGPYLLDLHIDKIVSNAGRTPGGNARWNGRITTDGHIPDPRTLQGAARAMFDHMASAAPMPTGGPHLGEVYVRMFNNPGVATRSGRLASISGSTACCRMTYVNCHPAFLCPTADGYEWSHHQRPAKLSGLDQATIDAFTAGEIPETLPDASQAALAAVDAVAAKRSIPAEVQQRFVAAHGNAGIVELVALCGLYGIMGDMCIAFDIALEEGFPKASF